MQKFTVVRTLHALMIRYENTPISETFKVKEDVTIRDGNKKDTFVNLNAIILQAYHGTRLVCESPHSTYWANGKLYKGPKEFPTTKMNGYWGDLGCSKSWSV